MKLYLVHIATIIISLISILFLFACSSNSSQYKYETEGKEIIEEASLLRITEFQDYSLVYIKNSKDTNQFVAKYILVNDSSQNIDAVDAEVIHTPLKNILSYSTIFATALDELNALQCIKGVADAQYFNHPEIIKKLQSGNIIDVGSPSSPAFEKIMVMKPDAILLSLYEGMNVGGLEKSNFPIIKFADNLEDNPLGRAEWIRFIGRLVGKSEKADSIFHSVKNSYNSLKEVAGNYKNHPKILTDNIYQGVWYVPGGNSFQAKLIRDAGGEYFLNNDNSVGSKALTFEEVFANARDADIWILKLSQDTSADQLKTADQRYPLFQAFESGNIYYSNTSKSSLFEDLPFHPDLILKEYIQIFHPEEVPMQSLSYFKKI